MTVKYMLFLRNFENFARIRLGIVTWRFLKSLITNLKSEYENSKWWIQYGAQEHNFLVKL